LLFQFCFFNFLHSHKVKVLARWKNPEVLPPAELLEHLDHLVELLHEFSIHTRLSRLFPTLHDIIKRHHVRVDVHALTNHHLIELGRIQGLVVLDQLPERVRIRDPELRQPEALISSEENCVRESSAGLR
jgi:hypothetical protein